MAVLGCAYEVNKGYFGLYLSNQRDLANANRMLSVMEQMPRSGLGAEIKVELAGLARFAVPGEPFSNALGAPGNSIVNCSGLACQNRLVDMLNLIGGGDRPLWSGRCPGIRQCSRCSPPCLHRRNRGASAFSRACS